MPGTEWWRFWSTDAWREWWDRRPAWKDYRSESTRLNRQLASGESQLSRTNQELAEAHEQVSWAQQIRPQDLPIKTAKAETGLASVAGVALLETRKRNGEETWIPVDHGNIHITDRQAVFEGSKTVKFRFDKIDAQRMTTNGVFLSVSSRKRTHILSGPADKIAVLLTAASAYASGSSPTASFEVRAASLTESVAAIEANLDELRSENAALVVPSRPVSPAWLPGGLVALLVLGGAGLVTPAVDPVPLAGDATTTTSQNATTSIRETTTSVRPTTTTSPSTTTTSTFPPVPDAVLIFAPAAASASGDPAEPLPSGAQRATVTSITDGDTLDVVYADGTVDTIRLIGINSPESNECWGDEAGFALAALAPVGTEAGFTVDVSDRDIFGRQLRYMWLGSLLVNEEMVRRGAAISRRYAPDTSFAARLESGQIAAQSDQLGLWAPDACGPAADADIAVLLVFFDAPGNDNENLNEEWIRIRNNGPNPVDLTGWGIRDESASNRYSFPVGFVLGAGEAATVFSGCGDDFDTELYWCSRGSAIWNNDGDTAFITDSNGNTHATWAYAPPTTTTTPAPTTTSGGGGGGGGGGGSCHPSYPSVCIPPPPPDLNCGDISHRRFTVVGSDPHGFDGDNDGVGCESG